VNVYAGVSRGTRSGVVDATYSRTAIAPPVFNYVLPETVWNYEAGIKAKIGRINADITAYKYDYTNLQIRDPSSILGALTNAGKASGKGVEASVRGPVAPGLDVIASYAYQDAHYDLFFDSTGKSLAGNVFRLSPKHKASLAANYDFDLSDALKGHVRVTEFYQSKTFFNADNLPYESQGGYALTNLGIGILDSHQGWSVEVFGNNLFSKNYLLDLGNTGKSFGLPTAIRGEPRVIGIRVQQNF
jgi:iron complex outermembrane receptor protein